MEGWRDRERVGQSTFSLLLCCFRRFLVLPLVEFWVEVSLLGGSSPLGGGLLVR